MFHIMFCWLFKYAKFLNILRCIVKLTHQETFLRHLYFKKKPTSISFDCYSFKNLSNESTIANAIFEIYYRKCFPPKTFCSEP